MSEGIKKLMSLRLEFAECMNKLGLKDKKLTVVVGDISHGILKNFRENSPNNYFNIGICEPSMVSFGAGLSKAGLIPVMHTIAPFLIERCVEQIKIDFSYNNLRGNFVSVGSSFDYSKETGSHVRAERRHARSDGPLEDAVADLHTVGLVIRRDAAEADGAKLRLAEVV